jgi:hypothetical protein
MATNLSSEIFIKYKVIQKIVGCNVTLKCAGHMASSAANLATASCPDDTEGLTGRFTA